MGQGCSRVLPKGLLPKRPGATSSRPGDLLHIPASRKVASLPLASSRAGLPSPHVGPGLHRPLPPTHVLTDLPMAISTADLAPPPHHSNGLDPWDPEEMGRWSPRNPT